MDDTKEDTDYLLGPQVHEAMEQWDRFVRSWVADHLSLLVSRSAASARAALEEAPLGMLTQEAREALEEMP